MMGKETVLRYKTLPYTGVPRLIVILFCTARRETPRKKQASRDGGLAHCHAQLCAHLRCSTAHCPEKLCRVTLVIARGKKVPNDLNCIHIKVCF
jgi:hypothetical protein